jgi:hypothetical protein
MRSGWREFFGAGAPGWYSIVALSFLFCEFNPIAAIGMAAGLKNVYASPAGWSLTALSFLIAMSGFIAAERIAFIEHNRRALEIGSIAAIVAGGMPLLFGIEMPAIIMWPFSAMFLITGASGLRACKALPHPARVDDWSARNLSAAPSAGEVQPEAQPTTDEGVAKTHRRRRRRRHRSRNRGRRRDGGQ